MADTIDLKSLFGAVATALDENKTDLNQAGEKHGDEMVQVFNTITKAVGTKKDAVPTDQFEHAARQVSRLGGENAGLYSAGLAAAAQAFQGQSEVNTDNVSNLLGSLVGGGQSGGGDAAGMLGSLLGGGQSGGGDMAGMLGSLMGGGQSGGAGGLMGSLMGGTGGGGGLLGSLMGGGQASPVDGLVDMAVSSGMLNLKPEQAASLKVIARTVLAFIQNMKK